MKATVTELPEQDGEAGTGVPALPGVTVHVWEPGPRTAAQVESRSRGLLAAHLGCPAHEVSLVRGPYGRLRVLRSGREVPRVSVSLSSAGSWRALALTSAGPVGVDVEPVPDRAIRPSASWCTPDELRDLAAVPDELLPRTTARLWTLKEAVLKALGTGLAVAPHRIGAAGLDGVPVVHSVDGRPVTGWETAPVALPDGYVGTVALRRRPGEPAR